jgi:hypothetical protein
MHNRKTSHTKTVFRRGLQNFSRNDFFFPARTLSGCVKTFFNGEAILKYPATGWSAERTEKSQFLDCK